MFVDFLNVISCFAVVVLHTTLAVFQPAHTRTWLYTLILQALFIFAVPIFFMISGMNLLDYNKRYSTRVYFKRRFWKISRSFLGGSLITYILFANLPNLFSDTQAFQEKPGIIDFIEKFLTNNINNTYWFFYDLIYLYLLVPVLALSVQNKRVLEYLITLTAFVSVLIPFLIRSGTTGNDFSLFFNFPLFSTIGLLYFSLGFYINRYVTITNTMSVVSIVVFFLSVILMLVLSIVDNGYFNRGEMSLSYKNYFVSIESPFCLTAAVSLFIAAKSFEPKLNLYSTRAKSSLRLITSGTLGVYLIHTLIINVIGKHVSYNIPPLTLAVLVFGLSISLVLIVKFLLAKIKALSKRASVSKG